MKILEIPFETIYKCNCCGCRFEIEPNDLSVDKMRIQDFNGESRETIINMYVECPYCENEIKIERKTNG